MGMARQEAEAILGDWPRRLARSHSDSVTVGWEAPDGATIEVDFNSHGRVTGKHFAESDQSFSGRIERIISRFPFH
jgi:YD repeat-containing protein